MFHVSKTVLGCAIALCVQSTVIGQVTSINTDRNDRVQIRLDRLQAELSALKSATDFDSPRSRTIDHPETDDNSSVVTASHSIADSGSYHVTQPEDWFSGSSFPTVRLTGFFQADAGWIHQDAANRLALGDVQDGADFREVVSRGIVGPLSPWAVLQGEKGMLTSLRSRNGTQVWLAVIALAALALARYLPRWFKKRGSLSRALASRHRLDLVMTLWLVVGSLGIGVLAYRPPRYSMFSVLPVCYLAVRGLVFLFEAPGNEPPAKGACPPLGARLTPRTAVAELRTLARS